MRLYTRFDMLTNERGQAEAYQWLFGQVKALGRVTLDLDSTVVTRNGTQAGAARGYHPGRHGRASHHPLLAFVAEGRRVANFWLRPGNAHSANNVLQFIESTLAHLGDKTVGLLRAVLRRGVSGNARSQGHPLYRRRPADPALAADDLPGQWLVGAGAGAGTHRTRLPGPRLDTPAAR
jgi:hypothetical protein